MYFFARFSHLIIIIALVTSILTGCMLGPDFHSPHAPYTRGYTEEPQPLKTVSTPKAGQSGGAQYFEVGGNLPAEWWTLFRSPELNALIETGLTNNQTLASAEAALRVAQENLNVQVGNLLFPSVYAQGTAERSRISGLTFGSNTSNLFNIYNTTVTASYTPDIFGGSRRQVEAYGAQIDYARFKLLAAYISLTSNIVTTAIAEASAREQIKALKELIQLQEKQYNIVKEQFRLGATSGAAVYSQQTQLAQTRAQLPPMEQNLAVARHNLAVLIGTLPSEAQLPTFDLNTMHLPKHLPVSIPASLVRQRPDIRVAEAQLHAASAQIGVATAKLFPQITLTADFGWTASTPSDLFRKNSQVWDYGAGILQPIFQGGALRAQRRAAIATYEEALADYRQTVLQGFQNVADTLRALQNDALSLQANKEAELAAHATLEITQRQYKLGGANYLAVIYAQQQYNQAVILRIRAEASRYADTAALFLALGGGWWNCPPTGIDFKASTMPI